MRFHLITALAAIMTFGAIIGVNLVPEKYPYFSDPPEIGGRFHGYISKYGWPFIFLDNGYDDGILFFKLFANIFIGLGIFAMVVFMVEIFARRRKMHDKNLRK